MLGTLIIGSICIDYDADKYHARVIWQEGLLKAVGEITV